MTQAISGEFRALVVARAGNRCEYCLLAQAGQEATFHVDHVTPRVAGGPTIDGNLALACVGCSLRKGALQSGSDPETGRQAALFNPRANRWHEHFRIEGFVIVGVTPTGRATAEALAMNRPLVVAIREEQALLGRSAADDADPQ